MVTPSSREQLLRESEKSDNSPQKMIVPLAETTLNINNEMGIKGPEWAQ